MSSRLGRIGRTRRGAAAWLALAVALCALGADLSADARGPRELLEEARRLHETRDVDRAAALFRDALTLAESRNLAREQAEALFGLGRIELEGDLRTRAKESLERALALFERAGDTTGHAQALAESGQARIVLGDAVEGIRRVRTAVETLRAGSKGTRDDVEGLARASTILMAMMPPGPDKDRARDAAFAAARAASSLAPPARGHECSIRHTWGADLLRAGEYAGAWRQLNDAVACYERVPNDRRLTSALLSLGSLKRTHGQFDAALAIFAGAVAISRERHDPVGEVLALNAVASAQTDLWRTDEARASLQSALALARARGMESLAPYTVGQLGAHHTQIGQFVEAIPFLEESLARAATVSRQIERLTQLCAARARGGDARGALPICDRNVTLARGDAPTALLYALRARAEARRRTGALDEASADLREAIELVEDLRAKTVPIDFMKRGFSAWHEWLFGSSISVAVQQRDIPRALETAERARARALLDLLATREVKADPSATVAAGAAGGIAASDPERRTDQELPRIDSSRAVGAASMPDMIATARRLRSTLLVYWVNPDAVYIWTITPDGAVHDARVEVPMAKVIGLVAATRAPTSQDAAIGLFALKASSSRRPWRELHDLLIAPIRAHLPKTPDALVTIVPHGPLAQLSFAALQDAQGRYLLERHTLHYTPAVGVLAYTAKRRDERGRQARSAAHPARIEGARADSARSGGARDAAARIRDARGSGAGDSGGGDASTDERPGAERGMRDQTRALLVGDPGELPGGIDGAPLAALPWARREVTDVAALLGGRATVLIDAEASEAAVRERLSGQSLLHFATHGVVREDEALESFLALRGDRSAAAAGAGGDARSAPSSASDGRLTADEVYELHLDADLVVLSACGSALGPTGAEGVIGFTRAFLYAGAASVIATSWNVPDASSYELMSRFYRVYGARRAAPGAGAARALRAAQLATLTALRQGKVTVTGPDGLNGRGTTVTLPDHPLFWAGFIVVGEP